MIKHTFRALSMLVFSAAASAAQVRDELTARSVTIDPDGIDVVVVNAHRSAIRVYAVDSNGRYHWLGTVSSEQRTLVLPTRLLSSEGTVQLTAYPVPNPGFDSNLRGKGIRSRTLSVAPEDDIYVIVERNLENSRIGVGGGWSTRSD